MTEHRVLIRNASLLDGRNVDVRIIDRQVNAIGSLASHAGEQVVEADGGLLLPGLHDHHIHFRAWTRALDSIQCGPPAMHDQAELVELLKAEDNRVANGWIRGIGYHESVAGDIDRHWLDQVVARRAIRIQHRSGRLWMVNSRGVDQLVKQSRVMGVSLCGTEDGRFFDQDALIGELISHQNLDIHRASRYLAALGITGFSDMTPGNDAQAADSFHAWHASGDLLQRVHLAGQASLSDAPTSSRLTIGATKIHLHDHALPPFDELVRWMRTSHLQDRAIAVHCVTELSLVYSLSAFRDAGVIHGDRIEHASVTPFTAFKDLRDLGLLVVTQPNFIAERGDQYRQDIPVQEHDWLYRCASFASQGIPLAAGSDAPFGDPDPWAAMQAAVTRQTRSGHRLGADEALSPEAALDLYLGTLKNPERIREVEVGTLADLCLLDQPWVKVRESLGSTEIRATLCCGRVVFDRIDQSPR